MSRPYKQVSFAAGWVVNYQRTSIGSGPPGTQMDGLGLGEIQHPLLKQPISFMKTNPSCCNKLGNIPAENRLKVHMILQGMSGNGHCPATMNIKRCWI